jgi:hypothetical protein
VGLISKTVKTKWNAKTKKYYISKGYVFTKMGSELEVKVEDLKENSAEYVEFECDYCHEKFHRKWCEHNRNIKRNGTINKICCDSGKCINEKVKESNLKNYGVVSKNCLDEYKDNYKNVCLEKYGVDCYAKSDKFKEKYKQIMQEKYGVDNGFQSEEIKEKKKQTCLKKYGVEYSAQAPEIKEKFKQTIMEKYGVSGVLSVPEIKEKFNKTLNEHYGVLYPLQSKEIKEKIINKLQDTYGVDNVSQMEEVKIKKAESFYKNSTIATSNQQLYLHNLLGGELNYSNNTPSLDIAFPNDNIYIEYNGGGHDLGVRMGSITRKEFENKERRRYYFLKGQGWKGIFINSPQDYLPSDEIIIDEINKAKEWFKSNEKGHSHYSINISDSINDNNYGHLKRIRKEDVKEAIN